MKTLNELRDAVYDGIYGSYTGEESEPAGEALEALCVIIRSIAKAAADNLDCSSWDEYKTCAEKDIFCEQCIITHFTPTDQKTCPKINSPSHVTTDKGGG